MDSYDHLDIAFDGSGNLHAIVNEDHLVLENGMWHTLAKDPCRKLIRDGQDLSCAFQVEGKDIGGLEVGIGIMAALAAVRGVVFGSIPGILILTNSS